MGDLIQNQSVATLRRIRLTVLDSSGLLLPLNHTFSAADFTLLKPDGTAAAPTNAAAMLANSPLLGRAEIEFTQAELSQVGQFSLYAVSAGLQANEWQFTVASSSDSGIVALLATVMDPTNAANSSYPANAKTFQQQWNVLMSWMLGPGDGLYGPAGSMGPPTIGEPAAPTRVEFTAAPGKRRFTKLDGT